MASCAPAGGPLRVYPVPAPVTVCLRLTSPPRAPFAKQGPGTHKKPAWIRVFSVCSSPTTTRGFFYTFPQPHNAAHMAERALPGRAGAQSGLPARGSFPLVPAYLCCVYHLQSKAPRSLIRARTLQNRPAPRCPGLQAAKCAFLRGSGTEQMGSAAG